MKPIVLLLITALVHSAIVPSTYDYIIVGAGFAGLGACRTLTAKGITPDKILVIEAKNRIGGRCTTFSYGGVTQDLGACLIQNPSASNPLHKLALANPSFTRVRGWFGNQTEWYVNKTKVSTADFKSAQTLYKSFASAVKGTYNNDYDINMQDLLNKFWTTNLATGYKKDKVNSVLKLWSIENGADLKDQSTWEYEIYFSYADDIDYTLLPTLSNFHQYLWSAGCKATLNLAEKVTTVDYSGTKILVTTDKATYYTNKIMLSPSLGILKAGLAGTPTTASIIKFIPDLPASKKNSINKIGFGKFEKLFLTFSQSFWDTTSSTLLFTCTNNSSCIFSEGWVVPTIPNTMLFFVGGSGAAYLVNRTLDQIKAEVVTFLNGFVDPLPTITDAYMTNWANDPNVLGGYSYASVGISNSTFNNLRRVLKVGTKNIWFIGEGTHPS